MGKIYVKKDYAEIARLVNEGKLPKEKAEEIVKLVKPYSVDSILGYYENLK